MKAIRTFCALVLGVAAAAAPLAGISPAAEARQASVTIRVCNNTSNTALVALSYIPVGESRFLNRGWLRVGARQCQNLATTGNRNFYGYAEVDGNSSLRWGGNFNLCVQYPGPYRFYSTGSSHCASGQSLVGFRAIRADHEGVFTWNLNY